MKIDSLWVKIFGVMASLNIVYWILSVWMFDVSNDLSGSLLFSVYVAPAILPILPFVERTGDRGSFVLLIGVLCLVVIPLFWSLALYGFVRLVRVIRSRLN